jgi:hypothetical protein
VLLHINGNHKTDNVNDLNNNDSNTAGTPKRVKVLVLYVLELTLGLYKLASADQGVCMGPGHLGSWRI